MTATTTTTGPAFPDRRPSRRVPTARVVLHCALVLGLLATLAPFAWMFLGSVKPTGEIVAHPSSWLPRTPTLANFEQFLTRSLASIERGRDKMHAIREMGAFQGDDRDHQLPF